MKIDFHNHFYPTDYLKRLKEWGHRYDFTQDGNGLEMVKEERARYLGITPQVEDPEKPIADKDRIGVDIQVLTPSTPNVYFSMRKRNANVEILYLMDTLNLKSFYTSLFI